MNARCRDSKTAHGSFVQKLVGLVMILVGALILCLFVPFETWMAVVGVGLIVGGIALRM